MIFNNHYSPQETIINPRTTKQFKCLQVINDRTDNGYGQTTQISNRLRKTH